jgi:hypothetical protein
MRGARPWFPGHAQPRQPLLGELNERDPETWRVYVDLAADHGVDVFLWDWYWYRREPAMHEALEDGFLRAPNRERVRFAVMWTNHPWMVLFPTVDGRPAPRFPRVRDAPDDPAEIRRSLAYIVARYFHLPGYWHLDGKPVLVVWDGTRLASILGAEGVRALLDELRALARSLGHDGIHLHHDCTLAAVAAPGRLRETVGDIAAMGFDSTGLYAPIAVGAFRRPSADYAEIAATLAEEIWPEVEAASPLPAFPAVGPGWDTSPRYSDQGPGLVVGGDSPAAFGELVAAARAYLARRPAIPQVLTVGCWNEWTESQYLLPDTRFGFGMLKALAAALGIRDPTRYVDSPAGELPHLGA